jgi:hypothetical protein
MTKTANIAWKIQNKFAKIDDIVWWAWIWHMTWAFNPKVEANANIINEELRLKKWAELLWNKKLTQKQNEAIIVAHKVWEWRDWAGVYNYTQAEILEKSRLLKNAWFNKDEIRILMENWIVWKAIDKKLETVSLEELNILNLPNVNKLYSDILKLNNVWVYIRKEWAKRLYKLNIKNIDQVVDYIKELRKKGFNDIILEIDDIENFLLNPKYSEYLLKVDKIPDIFLKTLPKWEDVNELLDSLLYISNNKRFDIDVFNYVCKQMDYNIKNINFVIEHFTFGIKLDDFTRYMDILKVSWMNDFVNIKYILKYHNEIWWNAELLQFIYRGLKETWDFSDDGVYRMISLYRQMNSNY